jgi:hypothetical protein
MKDASEAAHESAAPRDVGKDARDSMSQATDTDREDSDQDPEQLEQQEFLRQTTLRRLAIFELEDDDDDVPNLDDDDDDDDEETAPAVPSEAMESMRLRIR